MNTSNNSWSPTGKYRAQISEADLQTLQGLIGRQIHLIYAPCLQVAGAHLTSPSFSVPVSDEVNGKWIHKHVNFSCKWLETPVTLTDYWEILVSLDDKPRGIEVNSAGAIVAPCTVRFYESKPIRRIDIFEFQWSDGQRIDPETVTYDKAIRFESENGRAFCIACQLDGPGIATEVHLSEDEAIIGELLEGSRLRICLMAM